MLDIVPSWNPVQYQSRKANDANLSGEKHNLSIVIGFKNFIREFYLH